MLPTPRGEAQDARTIITKIPIKTFFMSLILPVVRQSPDKGFDQKSNSSSNVKYRPWFFLMGHVGLATPTSCCWSSKTPISVM